MDQLLQARAQPLIRDAHRTPQAAQRRRRGVQQLAAVVDARLESGAQLGQRLDLARQLVQQRPPLATQRIS
jgi:hypothetical protein